MFIYLRLLGTLPAYLYRDCALNKKLRYWIARTQMKPYCNTLKHTPFS